MPEMSALPITPQVNLEDKSYQALIGALEDNIALTLVNQTFFQYQTYRQQNHDRRWNANDGLYFGWVPQKMWEGSNIPRASISNKIVFDQVETALPAIMQALFGSQPDWFQIEPDGGGSAEESRAIQDHLLYLLNHDHEGFGLTAQNDIEIAIKCLLLYGNGGLSLEWDPIGNRPIIGWVDNRDIFFDPAAPVPSVDYSRAVIRRSLKTVEEIREWRNNPAMSIPSDPELNTLSMTRPWAVGDQTKEVQAALMGVSFNPSVDDWAQNPAGRRIEVLTYTTRTQTIVVLGRTHTAFSGKNPYGYQPYVFAPCYIVPGRSYSMSLADVQESNQLYAQALLNGRLDELSLALHPPRATKRSTLLTPSQQRWRPGANYALGNPKEDMQVFEPAGATTNVFAEIDYIERMAEKTSGINALSMGTPRPGNANRTLGGMQMQAAGGQNRLMQIVKHVEDYMLVPLLYKMYRMIRVHSDFNSQLPGQNGKEVPAAAFFTPVKFRILASSQMMTREKLMMVLPTIMQFVIQGPLMGQLQQTGRTVDFDALFRMVMDATGVGRSYPLIRPLNEQEKQAMQQPSAEAQAEQQRAQQADNVRMTIAREKNQNALQVEGMKQQADPMEMQREQMKMEMEERKAAMDMQMKQFELQIKEKEGILKLQLAEMKANLDAQKAEMDMRIAQQTSQQKMALSQVEGQQSLEQSKLQHEATLAQTQQSAAQQAELGTVQHETAMSQAKEKAALKPQPGDKPAPKDKK